MPGEAILVIDDHPLNLRLAEVVLRLAGYDVHTAGDAEQAMVMLASIQPALIVMDIQLPGMDGLTLTRRLKADPRHCHIPILAVSAYAMKGDAEKALDAGCAGYLTKPIDTDALPHEVARHLASSAARLR